MNNKSWLLYLIFPALLIHGSCSKDPLTKPSSVNFEFGMSGFTLSEGGTTDKNNVFFSSSNAPGNVPGNAGLMVIDQGTITISSIEFEGRREQGLDVFFTSDLEEPVIANLHDQTTSAPVRFDIPQGVYNHIEVVLNLGQNNQIPLVLQGKLTRGPMQDYPVRFEYRFTERIRIKGQGKQGQQVVLQEDKPSNARVELQTENLFRLINMGMVMNANIINENGQDIILIDNTNNLPIYNMIANRLINSFSLVID